MLPVRSALVCLAVLFVPSAGLAVVPPHWVPPLPGRLSAEGILLPPGAVRALGSPRFRNAGWIADRTYSPDGKIIVACGGHAITAWDAATGAVRHQVVDPDARFQSIRFSPDGRSLWATSSLFSATAQQWVSAVYRIDLRTWTVAARTPIGDLHLWNARLSPTGAVMVSMPNGIGLFEPAAGKIVQTWTQAQAGVQALAAASDDGRRLAVGTGNGVQVFDARSLEMIADVDGIAWAVAFGPGGRELFVLGPTLEGDNAGRDTQRMVRIWDLATKTVIRRLPVILPENCHVQGGGMSVAPDEKTVVVSLGDDHGHRVLDANSGKERFAFHTGYWWWSTNVAFHPNGQEIAAGGVGVGFWSATNGKRHPRSADLIDGGFAGDGRLTFSPDGASMTAIPIPHGDVVTWNVATGREVKRVGWAEAYETGYYGAGPGWAFMRSRLPVTRSADGLYTARVVRDPGGLRPGRQTEYRIVVSFGGADRWEIPDTSNSYDDFMFSPDNRYLIGGGYHWYIVYEIRTGKSKPLPLRPNADPDTSSRLVRPAIVPHPDGKHVAVIDTNRSHHQTGAQFWSVGVFDLDSGKEVARYSGTGMINGLAWAPDGTKLAVVGGSVGATETRDGMLFVGAFPSGRQLLFQDRRPAIQGVAFSPDGHTLALAGIEVRLIETATGGARQTFAPASVPLAFAPDGRTLATGGPNSHVFLWDIRGLATPPTDLDAAWAALAGDDAAAAYRAVQALAADPNRAIPFLAGKQPDEPLPDPARIPALVRDLDAPAFADRERANRELRRFGAAAEAALRQVANESPSPEVRQRAAAILAVPPRPPAGAELRALRSVEAVGWMETPAAAKLLQRWAAGDSQLRLTAEARATVARLHRR